jgi:RNA polymerase sigma-70 factor (ECF subfamily)
MLAKVTAADKWKLGTEDIDEAWTGFRKGREESLSKLFCHYYNHLYNYGYNMVQSEELVKDCIQDLFLRLWDRRKKISEAQSVKSYLLCSLKRMILRKIKKSDGRKKRNNTYVEDYFEEVLNIEEMMIHFEMKAHQKRRLSRSLESLSGRQKEAIYLKFYGGLSTDETACLMQINKQSVYNHVSQAIKKLSKYSF